MIPALLSGFAAGCAVLSLVIVIRSERAARRAADEARHARAAATLAAGVALAASRGFLTATGCPRGQA